MSETKVKKVSLSTTNHKDNDDEETQKWSKNHNGQVEHEDKSRDTLCGLGSWRPKGLQKLANHNVFTVSFIVVGIARSMIHAYFNGTITTVEKVFGISSRAMGILLTGNDISQIVCGMAVTHVGGKGSRPLWIAIGMMLTATACFTYGSCQLLWNGNINLVHATGVNQSSTLGMCSADTLLKNESTFCETHQSNVPSMVLFFFGHFISGVGSTALSALGFTYMDDNIKKRHSPLYIGATNSLRSFGPSLGYLLASICLRIYINPNEKPEYSKEDPRWLGAWWLGFLIMGIIQVVIAIPMLLFPKHLPSQMRRLVPINNDKHLEKLKNSPMSLRMDFMLSLRRLLKNTIVIFHLMSMVPARFGSNGMSTFMPKYLEAEFGQSASRASIFTGMSSKFMMMIGTFAGGFIIWKFKPRTVYITSWNAFVNITFVVFILTVMRFDCNDANISGINVHDKRLEVTSTCSQNCNCELRFDPVCVKGQNFLSPCLAGCTEFNQTPASKKKFYNCACGSLESDNGHEADLTAISGYCPNSRGKCDLFWVYISLFAVTKFISSTSKVGSAIILIRSVQKKDKALAMALMSTIISLFGFIPGPIIFGTLADSTCLLWKTTTCGQRGNCWLYDVDKLRYWFHGIVAICYIVSLVFDIMVCIYSRHVNLYDEDSSEISYTLKNKDISALMKLSTQETKKV